MIPQSSTDDRQVIRGGVVSGVVAGALLMIVMTALTAASGADIWYGMKSIAAPFVGVNAMRPGFDLLPVGYGLALHFLVSVGWALAFASLFYGLSKAWTILAGAAWGVVVWLGMSFVGLPLIGLGGVREAMPIGQALASNVFFGLMIALAFLPFQRRETLPQARGRLLTV